MEYIGGPKLFKEEDAIFTTFHWQDHIGKICCTERILKFENT